MLMAIDASAQRGRMVMNGGVLVTDALDNDPNYLRLLYRVEAGKVSYLDRLDITCWRPWNIDQVLHWHPFKAILLQTKRAGLHIVSNWRTPDGEMRYGSNVAIDGDGFFIMSPGQIVGGMTRAEDVSRNPFEAVLLNAVLQQRFGLDFGATAKLVNVLARIPDAEPERDRRATAAEAA